MSTLGLWGTIASKWRRNTHSSEINFSAQENAEEADVAQWRIAGASVTGSSHQKAGRACDDAWFAQQTPNGFVVVIVSDGAGSALLSEFAACVICKAFEELVHILSALPTTLADSDCTESEEQSLKNWGDILPLVDDCLVNARNTLLSHAVDNDNHADDYLATVVGIIAHRARGVLCFHIGDGAITVFNEEEEELLTSQPENGEYLNQTYFLVEEDWKRHYRFSDVEHERLGSVFLMTDGVTDLAYHRRGRALTPEPKFFTPLIQFLVGRTREAGEAGIAKVLDTERAKQLVDDDKTLVWVKPA